MIFYQVIFELNISMHYFFDEGWMSNSILLSNNIQCTNELRKGNMDWKILILLFPYFAADQLNNLFLLFIKLIFNINFNEL